MGEMRMPTVGAGFHARPAWVNGRRGFARVKWCAGGARGIAYAGRRTQGGRTVSNAVAIGHAERPQPVNRGRHATQGRARRWGGARNRRRRSRDGGAPGTVRPTTYGERFRIAITSSVIQRKGRRGRRPLRGVREGTFQRSCEVKFYGTRHVPCRKAGLAVARKGRRPRRPAVAGLPGQFIRTHSS